MIKPGLDNQNSKQIVLAANQLIDLLLTQYQYTQSKKIEIKHDKNN